MQPTLDQDDLIKQLQQEVQSLRSELDCTQRILVQKNQLLETVLEGQRQATRELERAMEKLTLSGRVSVATKCRQLKEMKSRSGPLRQLSRHIAKSHRRLAVSCSAQHRDRLDEVRDVLITKLDAPRVAAEMFQNNALTVRELEIIQGCYNERHKSAEILLNIIRRQSYETYVVFLEALKSIDSQREAFLTLVYKGQKLRCFDWLTVSPYDCRAHRGYHSTTYSI